MSKLVVTNIETQNIKFDSDTTAFTIGSDGVLSGTGSPAMVKLLDVTIGSVSAYDIDSTYINSTYDSYIVDAYFFPDGDNKYIQGQVFVGGTVQTGSVYANEHRGIGSNSGGNGNSEPNLFSAQNNGSGNQAGEGSTIYVKFQNTNNTAAPFNCHGFINYGYQGDGTHQSGVFTGSMLVANRADVVNGLRFKFHSGDIASGTLKLYGIK